MTEPILNDGHHRLAEVLAPQSIMLTFDEVMMIAFKCLVLSNVIC
mgnify:CR=1 FL=1